MLLINNKRNIAFVSVAGGTCLPSRCLETYIFLSRVRCIVTSLHATLFWCGCMKCSTPYEGDVYDWLFLRVVSGRLRHSITCRIGKDYGKREEDVKKASCYILSACHDSKQTNRRFLETLAEVVSGQWTLREWFAFCYTVVKYWLLQAAAVITQLLPTQLEGLCLYRPTQHKGAPEKRAHIDKQNVGASRSQMFAVWFVSLSVRLWEPVPRNKAR
jgi:hypothetical protein